MVEGISILNPILRELVVYKRGPIMVITPRYTTVFGRDDASPPNNQIQATTQTNSPCSSYIEGTSGTTHQCCIQLMSRQFLRKWERFYLISLGR